MKIFVAGATGTIGVPLVKRLVHAGHDVTGMTKSGLKKQVLADLGARAVQADALDERALSDAVRGASPDVVVDLLTAIPKRGPIQSEDMIATDRLRIEGTDNLRRASIAAGVKRIVAESMIFVYGYGDHGPEKLTEEDMLRPESFPEMRETVGSLRYLENTLIEASRRRLIQAVILRFGVLYGPDVPATQSTLQMVREGKVHVLSTGDGSKSWVYGDDAVSAIVPALTGNEGIYNIVDDEPAGYRDFILFAADILDAPRPPDLPLRFLRMTAPYSAIALSTRLRISNKKAKRELGWHPRVPNYRAGLQATAGRMSKRKVA